MRRKEEIKRENESSYYPLNMVVYALSIAFGVGQSRRLTSLVIAYVFAHCSIRFERTHRNAPFFEECLALHFNLEAPYFVLYITFTFFFRNNLFRFNKKTCIIHITIVIAVIIILFDTINFHYSRGNENNNVIITQPLYMIHTDSTQDFNEVRETRNHARN